MNKRHLPAIVGGLLMVAPGAVRPAEEAARNPPSQIRTPNIIFILADDLGYGDVSCFNPKSKIKTPNVDKLAAQGARFTDAHSPTAVCTPTRYALLTGRYSWRTRLARGVLLDYGTPLIAADRLTLPQLLRRHGYSTHCIGKWHLGFDWDFQGHPAQLFKPGKGDALEVTEAHRAAWQAVFSKPISGGPITRGFDTYFGTDVPNIPPYGFIRNDRFAAMPATIKRTRTVKSSTGVVFETSGGRPGPIVDGWQFDQILPSLVKEATGLIAERAKAAQPFFLYLPLTSPHYPVVPSAAFQGKSGLGDLADFLLETDDAAGQVMAALDKAGIADNTLLIFTSDNGHATNTHAPLADAGHDGAGGLRGHKATIWEGGHRVPFIARWPGHTPAGSTSDEPITHACMMATVAELFGDKLPENAAEDSHSILSVLEGRKPEKPTHPVIVHDSGAGVFALRWRNLKLILRPDGQPELYDLKNDLAERRNLAAQQPDRVASLTKLLQSAIARGRTTPGPIRKNDRAVKLNDPTSPLNE